jgi:hypothetical protein
VNKKEAKKLCSFGAVPVQPQAHQLTKVFCFFFSKKKPFLNPYRPRYRKKMIGLVS